MSKNKKSKILNLKLPFLFVAIFAFVLFLGNLVLLEDWVKKDWVLGASKKADNGNSVNAMAGRLENVSPKSVRAQTHVQKVKGVVGNLEEIAALEGQVGNDVVSGEISDAAEEIDNIAVENVNLIEEIDKRPAWKTFLLGNDYKNLGQLRSNLVQTDNQIRKITRNMARVEGAESDTALQAQLGNLNQERNRIMSLVQEEEQSFSLLGWVTKLLTGYNAGETESEVEEPVLTEPTE